MNLHGVIALILDPEVLINRITARRTCAACGNIVNTMIDELKDGHLCPACGGELTHRDDDNVVTVRKRIEGYRHETAPLLEYYDGRKLLYRVDGLGEVDEVGQRVADVLDRVESAAAARYMPVWEDKENI